MHLFRIARVRAVVALIVVAVSWTEAAHAQVVAYAGGGALIPLGEYGDYARTGWMGVLGAGVGIGSKGVYAGVELMYGSNTHKNLAGDKTNLPGALAWVEYRLGDEARPGPYFLGLAGTANHQFRSRVFPDLDASEWRAIFGIGAGINLPMRRNNVFVEARYMNRYDTSFAPILAGVSVPLGSRK